MSASSPVSSSSSSKSDTQAKIQETSSGKRPYVRYLWSVIVIAALGAAASIYSVVHHLEYLKKGATDAACNISERWSCDDIAASAYSEFLGLPLGVWGLSFFVALLGLAVILLPRRSITSRIETHLSALIVLTGIGVVVSLVLGGLSAFVVKSFCLTCMVVYVTCLALAVASAVALYKGWVSVKLWRSQQAPWYGLTSSAVLAALVLAGFSASQTADSIDPTEHPDHPVQNEKRRSESLLSTVLSEKIYDIPVFRSAYAGLGEDYRKGNDNASVVLVEFADFQCPGCGALARNLERIIAEYGDRISVVFKNYPLDSSCNSSAGPIHPEACEIAVLARCAGSQGKFWQYHDLVFLQQSQIKKGVPVQLAQQVGLDDSTIQQCLSSDDLLAKVKEDIAQGHSAEVHSTPSVFINGRRYTGGRDVVSLSQVLDLLLAAPATVSPAGS